MKLMDKSTSGILPKNQGKGNAIGKKRKGIGCFMCSIIFLATLLGVTNVFDHSKAEWSDGGHTNSLAKVVGRVKDVPEKVAGWFCPREGCKQPTNDVSAKAADSAKAREVLKSVGNAAEIFSIRVGGGGDSLFPTNAFQMKDYMPPVVAKSINGCFNAPVAPLGGYVCQYEVDLARTNFLCKAIPANGYTGAVFVVQKDMKIIQVGDVTCVSTNSVHHKSNK